MEKEETSSYELWEILQGKSAIRDVEHVSMEINENKDKLIKGLSFFRKPSVSSREKLKKETQVKPLWRDFVLKLSKFLNLDEWQSLKLFHSYLQNAFRGSREQLQSVLTNEIHTETLLIQVMEHYFEERIYILNSLETILGHWQSNTHSFQEPFATFVNHAMENDQLLTEVWGQYKECCKAAIHLPKGNELDMVKRHSHRFAQQLLREQIAVLRIIFFLYKDFEQPAGTLLEAVKLFQAQGFGTRQVNRHIFDGFTELMVTQIGFLQVMILVEAMKLESLIQSAEEESLESHPIAKENSVIKELDAIFGKWGELVHHGPVMLAWTAVRFIIETDQDTTQNVRRLGTKALQCNVFPYLLNLMKSTPFTGLSALSNSVKSVIYNLLSVVLTLFHESTLGDLMILIAVLKETLTSRELCEMFWQSDPESGMAMLLKSARTKFPFRFTPFTQIMTSLAKDKATSENLFNYLNNLTSYTECSNVNSLEDVDCTDSDETLWKLINAKILYKSVVSTADKIVIPSGTFGKVYMSNEGMHLLRWSFKYSCWQLFLLELDSFLQYAPHSTDRETQHFIVKVIDIIEIVNNVLQYNWSKISSLVHLVDRIYYILQKYSANPKCPPELITACVKCLTTVTSHEPFQSWISFQQTGFLPFCISFIQPTEIRILLSAVAVDPGNYGNFLTARERSHGSYSVTLATLEVIKELVAMVSPAEANGTNISGMNDFIACLVFVCRDIFNSYQKWHYRDLKEKQMIGLKCLEIFHKVLTLKETTEDQRHFQQTFEVSVDNVYEETSNVTKLCEILVEGILWTDIGQSLLHVVGIGMEIVDKLFAVHGSAAGSPAQLVVKLIKTSLAVLNEVLERKPQCSEEHDLSPLEQTLITHVSRKLSSDTPEGIHLVATISSYLYHKQDNELPTLAMELLRKICIISPMSMYGSLGSRAESLRDAFVIRLASLAEETRLKVAILDFLSAAVETQPGLMELFLDLNSTQPSSSTYSKEFKIGSYSCLKPVLTCIAKEASNPVFMPVVASSLKFICALWKNRRNMAMMTVKKSEKFWEHLSKFLMEDLPERTEEDFVCHLQICSFIFQIIAQEMYYIKSGQVDASLKKILEQFESKDRYRYWSDQVSMVTSPSFASYDPTDKADYSLNFLRSWRSFLIVLADTEISTISIRSSDVKMMMLKNAVGTIKDQFSDEISGHVLRIALERSSLFLMLLRKWIKSVQSPTLLIESVAVVLRAAHNAGPKLLAHIRIPLFSSLSLLLQHTRAECIVEELEHESIASLLPLLCEPLQYRSGDLEKKETLRQNKVLTVTLCLLNEIVTCISQPLKWLQIFTEHALFTNLIQILDNNLRKKENIDVVDAALHFILSLSKYSEAAQALGLNFIVQPLCLGMACLHQKTKPGAAQKNQSPNSGKSCGAKTWEDIWGLGLTVMAALLGKLRYEFLKESLDFVGVHRERLIQAMDIIRFNQSEGFLREAEHITMFLVDLSFYRKEWQLALPDVLQQVLSSTTVLFETCISLLIRPRLLAHLIEKPYDEQSSQSSGSTSSRRISSTSELLRPFSTPDDPLERQNPKVVETQKRLLRIVCNILGFLQNFSPNICEILLDESMDIDEYTPLFVLGFSAPTLENENPPSFGSLLSCLNVCLGHMNTADPRSLSSPDKSPWKFTAVSSVLPKSSVNFAMDNSIILLLSQALLCLKDPRVESSNKSLLKRKLRSELEPFLSGVMLHFERRSYTSPGSTPKSASPEGARRSLGRGRPEHWEVGDQKDLKLFKLVDIFLKIMKR